METTRRSTISTSSGDRTPFALENGRALTLATSSDSNFEGVEVRELVID